MVNQHIAKGKWEQIKGKIKERWGELTDDDLRESEGNLDTLVGKITERYGITKEEAQQKLSEFLDEFGEVLENKFNYIKQKSQQAAQRGRAYVQKNPLATIGVSFAAGALTSLLLLRSR